MRHRRTLPFLSAAATVAVLGAGALQAAPATAAPGAGSPHAVARPHSSGQYARHALRAGLTDQDFYFLMGDRFANGDQTNDEGGLEGDRDTTGFDPTSKAFYNGGDLEGV